MPSCKFCQVTTDWVPMPFGCGNCRMETSDCTYDGDAEIPDECPDDETCPLFEPSALEVMAREYEGYPLDEERAAGGSR